MNLMTASSLNAVFIVTLNFFLYIPIPTLARILSRRCADLIQFHNENSNFTAFLLPDYFSESSYICIDKKTKLYGSEFLKAVHLAD